MQLEQTQKALDAFKDFVIRQAQHNLSKKRMRVSKELYNSLEGVAKASPNSIQLEFKMADYGVFQDKGVSGTEKKYDTPFSYKSSSNLVGLEYHKGTFASWARFRGMQPRLKSGKYGTYKQMGFILANSIKKKGIKPSLFFTKQFEKAFKQLPDQIKEKFGLDLDNFLQYTINQDNK